MSQDLDITEAKNLIAHYTAEIEDLEFELGQSNKIIKEQQAEIEQLKEKYQNAHREGYEHGKLENQYEVAELAIENAELQKQVDELKFADGASHSEDEIRKVAKWISASTKPGVHAGMKCSSCGARIKYSEFYNGNHNFCHKCGAKMGVSNK
jgi:DNA repair exonuclease SbcCD ATPase subunit